MSRYLDWLNERLPLSEFVEKHITGYPTPRNLNYSWNFGSVLGIFFVLQVITGVWLAMYYKPDANLAFDSIQHIMRDVNYGWLLRYLHAIGATGIFFALYVHMGRGLYYGSYKRPRELLWWIGLFIFMGFMAEAFMGYLLPWGQMSYWGATVITNLFTAIPFYAILRSIPDKLGGVIAMGGSILLLALLPFIDRSPVRSSKYRPVKKVLTWIFFVDFVLLGYVGMHPPDFISPVGLRMATLGMIFTVIYFLYFALLPVLPYFEKTRPLPEVLPKG